MKQDDRRAVRQAWRERETRWAVVALRIGARVWVKLTPDVRALENRFGFLLRQNRAAGLAPGMAEAHAAGGAVTFETLETLDPDLSALARARIGAARLAHWAERLGATAF